MIKLTEIECIQNYMYGFMQKNPKNYTNHWHNHREVSHGIVLVSMIVFDDAIQASLNREYIILLLLLNSFSMNFKHWTPLLHF